MRYAVLIKERSHFRRNHVLVVRDRDERNFLTGLRWCLRSRGRYLLGMWAL